MTHQLFRRASAAGALCFFTALAHAVPVVLADASDDWFNGSAGNGYTVSGQPNDGFLRVFGRDNANTRAGIEFSMAGLNTGDTINSAFLQLVSSGTMAPGGTFDFWGYAGDGLVTDADATLTQRLLGSLPTGGATYNLDVTTFVQDLLAAGQAYAGILITVEEEGPSTFFGNDFSSREYIAPPVIATDATPGVPVPEPSTAALVSLALAGLAWRHRQSTHQFFR